MMISFFDRTALTPGPSPTGRGERKETLTPNPSPRRRGEQKETLTPGPSPIGRGEQRRREKNNNQDTLNISSYSLFPSPYGRGARGEGLQRGTTGEGRSNARGFTLVELLAATIAGLFVVLATFLLSRGSTRLFSGETRIGASQFSLRIGIDRLRSDLERAGFMTTANQNLDPDLCPQPTGLVRLQSLTHIPHGSALDATLGGVSKSVENGLSPDSILIQGNFASSDAYLVASVDQVGTTYTIRLQRNNGAVQRLVAVGETSSPEAALSSAFPAGQLLRLTNPLGSSQYLIVAGTSFTNGTALIQVAQTPSVQTISATNPDKRCGISGYGLGSTVNAVQIVRYDVRSIVKGSATTNASAYQWAYPNDIPADEFKYDLVRRVINPLDGSTIPNSETIVADYVVDLAFAFSADVSAASAPGSNTYIEPNLVSYPFDDPGNIIASDLGVVGSRPQRIRSVRYRLSTRSREPDRSVPIDDGGAGLARYRIDTNQYARVRTVMGEVSLPNQQGIRW